MTPRVWPPALDWSASTHWDYDAVEMGAPRPCVLCGKPSPLLSDDGKPCHKVCAENWFEQHPEAWAAYEDQRDHKTPQQKRTAALATDPSAGLFAQAA